MAVRHYFSLAFVVLRASAYLYWVDPACDKKLNVAAGTVANMVEESISIAGMIRQRLQRSKTDEPIAHDAFSEVFGFDLDDTLNKGSADRFKTIIGGFPVDPAPEYLGISEWIEALDQSDANARIRCDNGEGFKEVHDSKAPAPARAEYYAEDDQIKVLEAKPCSKGNEVMSTTVGYKGVGDGTQAEPRARITICDHYIGMDYRRDLWEHKNPRPKYPPIDGESFLTWFAATGSLSMLHELTHVLPYQTNDQQQMYGWAATHGKLFPDAAVGHADSYALLGTLVMLMEDKYKMEEGDRTSPTLVYDESIPGRVSSRKFKRLSSGDEIFG